MMDRRRRQEPDLFLDWKVRIFFVGAALLGAGVFLRRDVLALVAAAVLGVGLVLALVGTYRERRRLEAARFVEDEASEEDAPRVE
ncbi:MAG TPA: hypothetical protein VF142_13720 [Longimicrobium sp.]